MNVTFVYEDSFLAVCNKPPGLLTVPAPGRQKQDLTALLNLGAEKTGLTYRFHPCHRLDRETSGLIIYAKGKSTQKKIMELFHTRQVKKTYLAFLHGRPDKLNGRVTRDIEGKKAVTVYETAARSKDFFIVKAYPETGRTNQLRIHFTQIGHPIVGESKYIFRRDYALRAGRVMLHARELEFKHPFSGENLRICAPLPVDMVNFLNKHGIDRGLVNNC